MPYWTYRKIDMSNDAAALASRWRAAVTSKDFEAFGALYAPSATVWTNLDDSEHSLAEHLAAVSVARLRYVSWEYFDVRCEGLSDGAVSRHRVRLTSDAEVRTTVAAVFFRIGDNRILRLEEYLFRGADADRKSTEADSR